MIGSREGDLQSSNVGVLRLQHERIVMSKDADRSLTETEKQAIEQHNVYSDEKREHV
jgi:hypothetical protein